MTDLVDIDEDLYQQQQRTIYSVSDINAMAKNLLEDYFEDIWISGEISNFVCPSSGHWYFSIKDSAAQLRCAMFRGSRRGVLSNPEDGMQVLLRGKLSIYPARGDYQFIVTELVDDGLGQLQREFEALKKRLGKEGLFDPERKQALPELPVTIGLVTSATGAAVRDSLTVLKRRFACANLIIYPCLVQGEQAADSITNALSIANQRQECDVLLLIRGGGSLEDLWPFNEERVARAIAASELPIVTGVGHEVDFTIADFVADERGATPSAAAELISPDGPALVQHCQQQLQRLHYVMTTILNTLRQQAATLANRLQHPSQHYQQLAQRLDQLELRLRQSFTNCLQANQQQLATLSAKLQALSPLATLARGYAIVSSDQHVISNVDQINVGDNINVQLVDGKISCLIELIE